MNYSVQDHKYRPASPIWRWTRGRRSRRILAVALFSVVLFALYHHSHAVSQGSTKAASPPWKQRLFPHGDASSNPAHERRELSTSSGELDTDSSLPGVTEHTIPAPDDSVTAAKLPKVVSDDAATDSEEWKESEGSGAKASEDKTASQQAPKDGLDDKDTSQKPRSNQKHDPQQPLGDQGLNAQDTLPKGPVNVKPDLDQHNEKEPVLSSPDVPVKEKVIEAESEAHLTLEETADNLPDLIHIPFEDAVKNYELEGWEDSWIAHGKFDADKWKLEEPKIDFVYLWVNGSEEAFQTMKHPYELNSVLNDAEGKWIGSHGVNRYRDWDELRYSIRSVEKYASTFRNNIQILVNAVDGTKAGKQVPTWLKEDATTKATVQVLSQEEMFDPEKHVCLPTFNSLTIENQLFNTPSDTDYVYALSDDMLLGKPHTASDIHSPLFGPVMGFKTNSYNTVNPPNENDAHRFGEKPYLIYTSWLLNRRFGNRKRKGQGHFGHALSRAVMKEAISSFPGPELQSACKRFRGEPGFQLYSWYITFHYLIERHREAMIWSYILLRSDVNGDGFLDWSERRTIMKELEEGMQNEGKTSYRKRNFFHTIQLAERAGLKGPVVNTDVLWTSLDGPSTIMGLECTEFDVNECLAPGFSISSETTGGNNRNPMFSTPLIFDRLARQKPDCGDCLIKLLLNRVRNGLSPVLPDADTQAALRKTVIKALMRYRYQIVNPDALFVMVTDAEQVDASLTRKYVRGNKQLAGQLCLNDDVTTTDDQELQDVMLAMSELYQGLFPEKSVFER